MSDSEPTIRCLSLRLLAPSPENVRKTPAGDSAFEELKASIAAHGLLENLIVAPQVPEPGGPVRYAVIAGGRRLAALQALANEGALAEGYPVSCHIVTDAENAVELSLAENTVRAAMHPADQVEAFARIARDGGTVAGIASRFGVSERTVEQRLRLGNAAPELLDAYRAGEMGLQALQAFCVTADEARQRAVWEELKAQHHGPSVWQIRRILTEGRMPATSAVATFVGTEAYEAAGGALTRDLFAEEDERGTWFDDPVLLRNLALEKLESVAEELRTKWAWAEARVEVDWNDTARFARIRPKPGLATAEEAKEVQTLTARRDELTELDDDAWTGETESELERIEARLDEIQQSVADRAVFRRQDREIAGAIATVGDDGTLRLIQGLVRPEDIPAADPTGHDGASSSDDAGNVASAVQNGHDTDGSPAHIQPPALSRPAPSQDPEAAARKRVGIGVGLADDLRAIRTSLIKGHLVGDFSAAFDLFLFQIARRVFGQGYRPDALDISAVETPDRPPIRRNDTRFDGAARGEQLLEQNRSALPLDWLAIDDDGEAFQALRDLSQAGKESLFASCVARTAKGQLAFEPSARPELEATVARLGVDFASGYRPDAELFWSRLTKAKLLDIASRTLGPDWAGARSKFKKAQLVSSMERAFGPDGQDASHVTAGARAAALKWMPPGFEAFDAGGDRARTDTAQADAGAADLHTADPDAAPNGNPPSDDPAAAADDAPAASGPDPVEATQADGEHGTTAAPDPTVPPAAGNGQDPQSASPALPAFLRAVT